MAGRNNAKNRCERCRMYRPLCICPHIPKIELQTRVLVLMHWRERKLSTNTATLACLALTNSEIRIRGEADGPAQISLEGHRALLYPTEDSIELNAETALTLPRPLTLIVPDGSWSQARKVSTREAVAKNIPRLKLPPGPPSGFRLRHSPHERNLATIEAIARALGILEGPEIQKKLEALFLMMVERRLFSQGKLPAKDCTTGIPDAAFEAARLAGMAGGPKREE
jgi:DTW domain-containing protein YfiP